MLGGSVTASGEGNFWSNIPMSEGGSVADYLPPISNVTQMAAISVSNGSYGSMRPRGYVRHLAFW